MTTVSIDHLREWAEERFGLASGLVRSSTIRRQQWQERGKAEALRDLLHHLDSVQRDEHRPMVGDPLPEDSPLRKLGLEESFPAAPGHLSPTISNAEALAKPWRSGGAQ